MVLNQQSFPGVNACKLLPAVSLGTFCTSVVTKLSESVAWFVMKIESVLSSNFFRLVSSKSLVCNGVSENILNLSHRIFTADWKNKCILFYPLE